MRFPRDIEKETRRVVVGRRGRRMRAHFSRPWDRMRLLLPPFAIWTCDNMRATHGYALWLCTAGSIASFENSQSTRAGFWSFPARLRSQPVLAVPDRIDATGTPTPAGKTP